MSGSWSDWLASWRASSARPARCRCTRRLTPRPRPGRPPTACAGPAGRRSGPTSGCRRPRRPPPAAAVAGAAPPARGSGLSPLQAARNPASAPAPIPPMKIRREIAVIAVSSVESCGEWRSSRLDGAGDALDEVLLHEDEQDDDGQDRDHAGGGHAGPVGGVLARRRPASPR